MRPRITVKSIIGRTAIGVAAFLILIGHALQAQPVEGLPRTIDFEALLIGHAAAGFTPGITGGRGTVSCQVQADHTAPNGSNVLTIVSGNRTNPVFPLCLYDGLHARDVDVAVRYKPVAGRTDQAAGIIVRAQNFENYYVVRANALENNVRLYRVVDGRRTEFAGVDVRVPSGTWQILRITAEGAHFTVYLDDKRLFAADDRTIADTGRVGLWVKSDSVTLFDDLTIFSASK